MHYSPKIQYALGKFRNTLTQARTSHKQTQIELINFLVLSMLCLFDFIEEEAEQKQQHCGDSNSTE